VPSRRLRLNLPASTVPERVRLALAQLRGELDIPEAFPEEVLRAAVAAAESGTSALAALPDGRVDLRDIPFLTIDPPGSMDLDQALHLSRSATGYVVDYAIADVAHFVAPRGPIDVEANGRGMTVYAPESRTPLHPPRLSEDAASLLPGVDRPAVAWRIELDAHGEIVAIAVRRAVVQSQQRFTYEQVQSLVEAGDAPASFALLREIGQLRRQRERDRGGVSLNVPEQTVTLHDDGGFDIERRAILPAEEWNAQISLLTGIAAARLMRDGGIGILRTLPASDSRDVERLRRAARALGIDWPATLQYADLLATLDSRVPQHAAFLNEATSLFRGASYLAFTGDVPDGAAHSAIAAEYTHVTAPLRRLVDRYAAEICLTLSAGGSAQDVPMWVTDAFAELPRTMARTGQRASSFERGSIDIVEAALLTGRVGKDFRGVVIDVDSKDPRRGAVVVDNPAVQGTVTSESADLPLGEHIHVRLAEVSIEKRHVRFSYGK
jgi:VacB/RNase II family 3'-5' exoribonuclease